MRLGKASSLKDKTINIHLNVKYRENYHEFNTRVLQQNKLIKAQKVHKLETKYSIHKNAITWMHYQRSFKMTQVLLSTETYHNSHFSNAPIKQKGSETDHDT